MSGKEKSNETSTGHHPFIINPKEWVGTPWANDGGGFGRSKPSQQAQDKSNEQLIADLHYRLATRQNVSDLVLGEKGRSESLAASGQAPVFPGAKKKLSTTGGPTPSAQQKEKSADPADANPFAEELRAKRLPLDCTLPVAWALPPGFSLRHLDGAVYLPLFAHGLRDPTEHLGVPLGAVASEGFRDLLAVHGPAGRVFRHLKIVVLPLRQAFAFAANEVECADAEASLVVAGRALEALCLLATCDDGAAEPSTRGAVAAALFAGQRNTPFALLATPLVSLRGRVAGAREFARQEPRFTAAASRIAACLALLEDRGGAPARRAIAAAFPGGLAA